MTGSEATGHFSFLGPNVAAKRPESIIPEPLNTYPVTIDSEGRIFREDGSQLVMTGLEPSRILEAMDDLNNGRLIPFDEIISKLNNSEKPENSS